MIPLVGELTLAGVVLLATFSFLFVSRNPPDARLNRRLLIALGAALLFTGAYNVAILPFNAPFAPSNNIMQYACGVTIGDGGNHELNATSNCGLNGVTSLSALAAVIVPGATPSTPFAFVTNPSYGLTFTMPTSVAQGSPGTTLSFYSTSNPSVDGGCAYAQGPGGSVYNSVVIPCFNGNPTQQNVFVQDGMNVTGSCIAANTTVSSYSMSAGTITLNQNTSSACAANTTITFTVSATQIGDLSLAWLSAEAGVYAAAQAGGGTAWAPRGTYVMAPSGTTCCQILIPNGANASSADTSDIVGEETGGTVFQWKADLGFTPVNGIDEPCAITPLVRASLAPNVYTITRSITLEGPGTNAQNTGTFKAGMYGLCIAGKSEVLDVFGMFFHVGLSVMGDHQLAWRTSWTLNDYDLEMSPNQEAGGNLDLRRFSGSSANWASIAIAYNSGIDASIIQNTDLTNSPYGFYYEAVPTTAFSACSGTLPCGGTNIAIGAFLSGTLLENVLGEGIGTAYIFSEGAATIGTVNNDTFIGSQTVASFSSTYGISGRTPQAVVDVYYFYGNVAVNEDFTGQGQAFGSSPYMATAVIEAQGSCYNNDFHGLGQAPDQFAVATIPFLSCVSGISRSNKWDTTGYNSTNLTGAGTWDYATGTIVAKDLVELNPSGLTERMAAATDTPRGVALQNSSAMGSNGLMPVALSGSFVPVNVASTPTTGTCAGSSATTPYEIGNTCSAVAIFGTFVGQGNYINLQPIP